MNQACCGHGHSHMLGLSQGQPKIFDASDAAPAVPTVGLDRSDGRQGGTPSRELVRAVRRCLAKATDHCQRPGEAPPVAGRVVAADKRRARHGFDERTLEGFSQRC